MLEKWRIITLVRPDLRNPLSGEAVDAIQLVIDDLQGDAGISQIVFTGADNAFASGADLREIQTLTEESAAGFAERGQRLMNSIDECVVPTAAFINGHCYGGGLDLALACRRRIASPNATFCHPGARLGIMTGWGGTQRLPRLIGEGRALELFLTAEPIDAVDALRIGLVDGISEDLVSMLRNEPI